MQDNTHLEIGYFGFEPLVPRGLEARIADFLTENETYAQIDEQNNLVHCQHYGFDFTLKILYGMSTARVLLEPKSGFEQSKFNYLKCLMRMLPETDDVPANKPQKIMPPPNLQLVPSYVAPSTPQANYSQQNAA